MDDELEYIYSLEKDYREVKYPPFTFYIRPQKVNSQWAANLGLLWKFMLTWPSINKPGNQGGFFSPSKLPSLMPPEKIWRD